VTRPFRIGVWCDYGVTLTPTEGIGVFVWNLIGGLLQLNESLEVVMLVAPGDQHVVADLQNRFPGRLRVVPPLKSEFFGSAAGARLLQSWFRFVARVRRKVNGVNRRIAFWRGTAVPRNPFLPLARVLPRKWIDTFDPMAVRRKAGCDVWLIPSNRFAYPLTFPSVLVIHDLVHVHYRDAVPGDIRWELEKLVPKCAKEATLCACMSRFIRDTDLRGHLHLSSAKVRVIAPAPPEDFPEAGRLEGKTRKPIKVTRPYLFYPAAFRSYKNHPALIEAIHQVDQSGPGQSLDLVLTGIHRPPQSLVRRIAELGLQDRVHILGCVDRQTLAAIYQNAFATIVPSLYEQGSFPIYEALHWGCPVACSDIPSLREQCEPLGDDMIYFNPHDSAAIAQAIVYLRDQREAIRMRQQSVKEMLWKRSWRDAARDWLAVLREAAHMAEVQKQGPLRKSA
jgi:glycosyltransferase involved in cell wall biosynthesis